MTQAGAPVPLPAPLLDSLAGADEVLVSSRGDGRVGTVPMGFATGPPGVVYLLTSTMSLKARRWEAEPWVRLTEPLSGESAEGVVVPLTAAEAAGLSDILVDRFMASGIATPEALVRLLEAGTHLLFRVEGAAQPPA